LRDFLRAEAHLVVTDLNSAMLDVARAKFGPEEAVDFQPANALSLPFRDEGFDALICQFGVMFFPDIHKGSNALAATTDQGRAGRSDRPQVTGFGADLPLLRRLANWEDCPQHRPLLRVLAEPQ
jgi:hypothetical protein